MTARKFHPLHKPPAQTIGRRVQPPLPGRPAESGRSAVSGRPRVAWDDWADWVDDIGIALQAAPRLQSAGTFLRSADFLAMTHHSFVCTAPGFSLPADRGAAVDGPEVDGPGRVHRSRRGHLGRTAGRTAGVLLLTGFGTAALAAPPQHSAEAPQPAFHASGGSPSLGLRPIGAPRTVGATVARNLTPAELIPADPPATAPQSTVETVRQTAYLQGGGFTLPPETVSRDSGASRSTVTETQFAAPPLNDNDFSGSTTPLPGAAPPLESPPLQGLQGLQPVPTGGAPLAAPPQSDSQPLRPNASPSDLAPLPQPQLPSHWATVDNCNLVSGPSGYRAEFGFCGAASVMPVGAPAYAPPPMTIMPGAPVIPVAPAGFGCRPLFTLGQENYNVQLGQGIIGQPTAYVPGQSFRNFIRYLSP